MDQVINFEPDCARIIEDAKAALAVAVLKCLTGRWPKFSLSAGC